jgi:hypothetical protein
VAGLSSGWRAHSLSAAHNALWRGDGAMRFDERVNTTTEMSQAYSQGATDREFRGLT